MPAEPLVTIALPVRNGADSIGDVARSVLDQDYERIEFLVSDNESTDATEAICRELARNDERVRYCRQPRNIGLLNNFEWTKHNCRGTYLRWIGDNDAIAPSYVSRCLAEFRRDPRRVLVTTGLEYVTSEGIESTAYEPGPLGADEPVVRVQEMLRLLNSNYQLLDPLYGMVRTEMARSITHDRLLRGDEIYALKLALAGPWGHVPEVLGRRDWAAVPAANLVALLEVPAWHEHFRDAIEARQMVHVVSGADLPSDQRRRAQAAVGRFYVRRHWTTGKRRARRIGARLGVAR